VKKNYILNSNRSCSCEHGRKSTLLAGLGVVVLFLLLSMAGCMSMDMGGSSTKSMGTRNVVSDAGLFRVSIQSAVDPIPLNSLHAWTIHVETGAGQPVSDAVISIGGGMPAHGHGLPTEPRVTANLGDGDYRVEGMKFHMQGDWVVTFAISAGGKEDIATLEFQL
jgi:hypothetical protein